MNQWTHQKFFVSDRDINTTIEDWLNEVNALSFTVLQGKEIWTIFALAAIAPASDKAPTSQAAHFQHYQSLDEVLDQLSHMRKEK